MSKMCFSEKKKYKFVSFFLTKKMLTCVLNNCIIFDVTISCTNPKLYEKVDSTSNTENKKINEKFNFDHYFSFNKNYFIIT